MHRGLLAALLLALFIASPVRAKVFVLGAEDGAGPWGQADGSGAGNEVVTEAFKAAGDEASLEVLPYARAKSLTLEGGLAGCFAMAWESSLEGRVVFADAPLYSVQAVFFENVDSPLNAGSLEEFPERGTLGIVTGYEYPSQIYTLKARSVRFIESSSEENSLKHLADGVISSAVLVLDSLKNESYILSKAEVGSRVRRVFEAGAQGSYVGFSTKHPDGAEAKASFDRGFAIIKANGVYKAILDRWRITLGGRAKVAK